MDKEEYYQMQDEIKQLKATIQEMSKRIGQSETQWRKDYGNLKQKLEEIETLTEDGFFNEVIYDVQGNFDQNDEDKTNKLKEILENK